MAFVVIALIAVIGLGGETPDIDDSPAEVASFSQDHAGSQAGAAFLLAASVPFLVLFAAAISVRLIRSGEDRPSWRSVLLTGAA